MAFGTPEAKFRITAEDKSDRALRNVKENLGAVHKGLGSISAALGPLVSAAGIGALTRQLLDMSGALDAAAKRTDTTVRGIQALNMLARGTGAGDEIMQRAMRNLTSRSQQGLDQMWKGSGPQYEAMVRMGLDPQVMAEQYTSEDRMEAIARGFSRRRDTTRAHTDLQALLGEEAGPALKEALGIIAREGLAELKAQRGIASGEAVRWAAGNAASFAVGKQAIRGELIESSYQIQRGARTDPGGLAAGALGQLATKMAAVHPVMQYNEKVIGLLDRIADSSEKWSALK